MGKQVTASPDKDLETIKRGRKIHRSKACREVHRLKLRIKYIQSHMTAKAPIWESFKICSFFSLS
jgi:hypothetical protein